MPTTRIDTNEVFDKDGNLISSETVEVTVPDATEEAVATALATLTPEQIAALVAALQGR